VGAFHLGVQARGGRPDVDVADALVDHVPVEGGLELGPFVGLHLLDGEGQVCQQSSCGDAPDRSGSPCVFEGCAVDGQFDVDVSPYGVRVGTQVVGSGHEVGRFGWREVRRV
jgi:hypothetical protein